MGLNIVNSGDFKSRVKYNSKADKWFIKGENGDVEIPRPTFVADLENIRTGWFLFVEGQAPSIVLDESLAVVAAKPSDKHKRGFKLDLFAKVFGGAVELSSCSMHICNSINDLYVAWEGQKDANKGLLPVVQCTGSEAQKDKFGTNYKPKFAIVKWIARPAEFDAVKESAPVKSPAPVAQVVEVESEF